MDWITILLLELAVIEFLVVIVLLALLSGRRYSKRVHGEDDENDEDVEEIEREAEAIAKISKKVRRK